MLADTEEVALSFEQTNLDNKQLLQTNRIRHPIAIFFHLFFRVSAILLYIFSSIFFNSFITVFVITIIFLSMDFWTVKNITGRLLAGLRWWNHIDEDGKSQWIFENKKNMKSNPNAMKSNNSMIESTSEKRIFWSAIIMADIIWVVFLMISFLTFSFRWMTIIVIAIMLNASNTYGFVKCRYGSESNLKEVATGFFGQQMLKSMFQRSSNTNQNENTNPAQ